ncbi:GPI transamidase subunit PIG-U [Necator americanus]|uniref:GPI transamidase subunit PIG-U n=1 Tax=Necator americanus TaxID=51031 RepID=W2TK73_NECAM|nr:GPI transamidase subunit PIG-U [Necator americanus]ETN82024.1 GPI transamidase subunit PIG-U [Necator americanus]
MGIGLRVLCFLYARPFLLKRAELTSPLVSYRRLQDGIAMYRDGISPYEGDLFHFQPFVLRLFSSISLSENVMFTIFMGIDCLTALLLSISATFYGKENRSNHPEHLGQLVLKCLKVDDLTPNVGLVWYFFTQVFEHFRAFYLAVFQINLLVYVVPLLLSLRKDAHLHLVISLLLVAVFSSYPTLNDASVYLALLPTLEKYKKYPRYTLVVAGTIITCIVLMPVMWHMWIVVGSGNANFYFAVTLFYNVAQIYLMIDLMFAYFRKEADEISASLVTPKTNFVLH